MMMMFIGTETLVTQHAGEREASGAYADAQVLQHAVIPLGAARINPRGVGDSDKLRPVRVLLACADESALHAGKREACSGAYADAHVLQHTISSLYGIKTPYNKQRVFRVVVCYS
jgi:hypothetical protein